MKQSLFRQQAVAHQGERLWGDLILSQPLSYTLLTLFLVSITVVSILFLSLNSFTRKQSVQGWLVPDKGLVEVLSPITGLVREIKTDLDGHVEKGQPLFVIQLDRHLSDPNQSLTKQLLKNINLQQEANKDQLSLEGSNELALINQKEEVVSSSKLQLQQLEILQNNQQSLLELKRSDLRRAKVLQSQNLLANKDFDNVYAVFLQQQNALFQLSLRLTQFRTQVQQSLAEKDSLILNSLQRQNQLKSELAELNKQVLNLSAEQLSVIPAPVGGIVSALAYSPGEDLSAGDALLTILPDDSFLQAEFLVPGNAIGFLREGQVASIRFDAFPYQKFGVHSALISRISTSPIPSNNGLAEYRDKPLYRVVASLKKQTVSAYGEEQLLKPGMGVSADIEIDSRSLMEWLLEPLFSIKGKS